MNISIYDIRKILLDRIDTNEEGEIDLLSIEQCAVQLKDYFLQIIKQK